MTTSAVTLKRCLDFYCDKTLVQPEYDKVEKFTLLQCDKIRALIAVWKPGTGLSPPPSTRLYSMLISLPLWPRPLILNIMAGSHTNFSYESVVLSRSAPSINQFALRIHNTEVFANACYQPARIAYTKIRSGSTMPLEIGAAIR